MASSNNKYLQAIKLREPACESILSVPAQLLNLLLHSSLALLLASKVSPQRCFLGLGMVLALSKFLTQLLHMAALSTAADGMCLAVGAQFQFGDVHTRLKTIKALPAM